MRPLAVSLGDPAGVGPELICEAWTRRDAEGLPAFFVAGGAEALRAAAIRRGLDIAISAVNSTAEAVSAFERALPVLGAVDEDQVDVNGRRATRLTLTHLKPGVARADVVSLAHELGLTDVVLY